MTLLLLFEGFILGLCTIWQACPNALPDWFDRPEYPTNLFP